MTLSERQLTMSDEIVDVDDPTPPHIIEEAPQVPIRDLGEPHELLLKIYHPKDENEQYVVRVYDPESGELYGTLFSNTDRVAVSFGNFIQHHLGQVGF